MFSLLAFILLVVNLSIKNKILPETPIPSVTPTPTVKARQRPTPNLYLANDSISSPVTIKGEVPPGWMFEGSFPVLLTDSDGVILYQTKGVEIIPGSWQSGENASFSATLKFNTTKKEGLIVLKKDNPSGLSENDDSYSTSVKLIQTSTKELVCTENNGKWIEKYSECENIKEDVCINNGGSYNNCDSMCRHEDPSKACILLCVAVCKF